jgi:ribosome recycling factor
MIGSRRFIQVKPYEKSPESPTINKAMELDFNPMENKRSYRLFINETRKHERLNLRPTMN